MSKVFTIPKEFHPDFAAPNRKPVGAVEVDRADAYGEHLVAGYLTGGELQVLRDVTGRHNAQTGSTGVITSGVADPGPYLDFSASGINSNRYNIDSADIRDVFNGSRPFTLIIHAYAQSSQPNAAFFSLDGTDDFILYLSDGASRTFRVFWRDVGGTVVTYNPIYADTQKWRIFGYTFDGVDQHKLFINGIQVASGTASGSGAGPYSSGPAIGGWAGSIGQYYVDKLASLFLFDGDFSGQISGLTQGLYQRVLKPSNPITYFIPSAGGGAYTLSGSSSISLTSSAGFTHNIHPSIAGGANVAVSPTGVLSYNQHHIISGSATQSITSSATMTYASGNEILGDVTLTVQPTATLDYNEHHVITGDSSIALSSSAAMSYVNAGAYEISGSVTVSATPSAALTYNQHPVLSGDTTFYFVSAATMAYATPQEYLLSGASGIDVIPASVMSYISILAAQYQGRRMTAKDRTRRMTATHKPRNMR